MPFMKTNNERFGDSLSALKQPPRVHTREAIQPKTIGPAAKREPISSPAYRVQTTANLLQAKLPGATPATASRSQSWSSSGVVQANVVGGNHALQARLNSWNTRLTRGM